MVAETRNTFAPCLPFMAKIPGNTRNKTGLFSPIIANAFVTNI